MYKCYHITDQELIHQEEREGAAGSAIIETYLCGECGEEYTEIKLI